MVPFPTRVTQRPCQTEPMRDNQSLLRIDVLLW